MLNIIWGKVSKALKYPRNRIIFVSKYNISVQFVKIFDVLFIALILIEVSPNGTFLEIVEPQIFRHKLINKSGFSHPRLLRDQFQAISTLDTVPFK